MNIVEYELKRHGLWLDDLRAKRASNPVEAEKNQRKVSPNPALVSFPGLE